MGLVRPSIHDEHRLPTSCSKRAAWRDQGREVYEVGHIDTEFGPSDKQELKPIGGLVNTPITSLRWIGHDGIRVP